MHKVEKGDRPTFGEIRKLDSMKREGYVKVIMGEHEDSQKYTQNVINQLVDEQDKIREINVDI